MSFDIFSISNNPLTTALLSGPSGKQMKAMGDNLTKKDALALAKKLRSEGIFASVFPSKKHPKKRVVIVWENQC